VLVHFRRFRNAVAQRLFNRRTLEVRRRLDVLQAVVDATLGRQESIDALDLMSAKYGYRWADHPGWQAHHDLLAQHLELLVQAGELEKSGTNYKLTGMSLKALEEAEDEDRKHSANLRVQLLLVVLTLVSAVMAAAQAGLVKLPTLLDLTDGVEHSEKDRNAGTHSRDPNTKFSSAAPRLASSPRNETAPAAPPKQCAASERVR